MKMVSMKTTKKEGLTEEAKDYEEPEYPYGTSITINDEKIAALGLDKAAVGNEMMITAKVKVTSKSEYDSEDSGKNASIEMQITDIMVEAGDKESLSDKMYGSDE